jgi:hypothetical protein
MDTCASLIDVQVRYLKVVGGSADLYPERERPLRERLGGENGLGGGAMLSVAATRMAVLGIAALTLWIVPAASAQNGFPAQKAAVDQYEDPGSQPPPQQQPAATGGGSGGTPATKPTRKGTEQSRGNRDSSPIRKGCNRGAAAARASAVTAACPAGEGGPDSAAGGGNKAARAERGSALPLAEAQGTKLPFTGFDLSLLAVLGVLMLAGGFALRAGTRARRLLR